MSLEKQLEAIKTKADFHKWIDSLPDDAIGVVLVTYNTEEDDKEHVMFREIGGITVAQSYYLSATWQFYLMGAMGD